MPRRVSICDSGVHTAFGSLHGDENDCTRTFWPSCLVGESKPHPACYEYFVISRSPVKIVMSLSHLRRVPHL